MIRRPRPLLLALALLAPVAIAPSSASAAEQDLVVSATAGAPGTVVEVSSASCVEDDDTFAYLSVRFIAGAAPDEVLAGAGASFEGEAVRIAVPDWIDPDAPAVIEAVCVEATFEQTGDISFSEFAYDPVPFDVEPGIDPAVQQRAFSRTSLLVGQAFNVEGSGCFLADADLAGVDVVVGGDLTARTAMEFAVFGYEELLGDAFGVEVALSNGGFAVGVSQDGDDDPVVDFLEEYATDLAPGTYTAFTYCGSEDGSFLFFEPQLIEVTGSAPFGDVDLVVADNNRDLTFAGGSCTAGPVTGVVVGESVEGFFDDWELSGGDDIEAIGVQGAANGLDRRAALRSAGAALPATGARSISTEGRQVRVADRSSVTAPLQTRAVSDEGFAEIALDPDAQGDWSYADAAGFDVGFVGGFALCGDPLADGFYYDAQVAAVQVEAAPVVPEPPVVVVPPAPPAPPAAALPGTPTYAG